MCMETKENKIDNVDIIDSNDSINNVNTSELFTKTSIDEFHRISKSNSTSPSHIPKTFKEQFYFKSDGSFWVYNNNVWVNVSSVIKTAASSGTSPASVSEQSISGLGFTPKIIILKANKSVDPDSFTLSSMSIGNATSTSNQHCLISFWRAGTINKPLQSASSNLVNLIGTDGASDVVGNLKSLDSDGFTIDWTTTNEKCDYIWEAIG